MSEEKNKKEEKTESGEEKKSKPENDEDNQSSEDNDNKDNEDGDEVDTENDEDEDNDDSYNQQLNRQGPRFNFIESYFFVALSVVGDICDGIWVTRFIFAPATIMWLYFKGVDAVGKNVIAQLVELIPGVGWLPISTVAAVLTIWQTNNPESFKRTFGKAGETLEKIQKIESKIKGKK